MKPSPQLPSAQSSSVEPPARPGTRRRLRTAAAAATAAAALAAAFPAAAHACPADHPGVPERSSAHRLTITVDGTGGAGDGTYTLECAPAGANGGTHPSPDDACERLDQLAANGTDPFEPVPGDALCTEQYGGPETAHITGTWQGRAVDAEFSRTDGCRIARWDGLVPVLPASGPPAPAAHGRTGVPFL
ncbi:SSI family serine proteinase inhibitor [Streptomyces aurantiacus]|uniref:SSI family serine proteinase inhibitor n=1 Tax=Streptomyces aurantiacus TaxID=47760 RepID=UPI00331B2314